MNNIDINLDNQPSELIISIGKKLLQEAKNQKKPTLFLQFETVLLRQVLKESIMIMSLFLGCLLSLQHNHNLFFFIQTNNEPLRQEFDQLDGTCYNLRLDRLALETCVLENF